MRRHQRTALVVILAVAGLAAFPGAAAPQTQLPDAAEIIDRHVEARGGRDALLAPASVRTRGVLSMPGMSADGSIEVVTHGGRLATTMTIPGMGEMRTGFNGEVGWAVDNQAGPRLLEGDELEAMRETSHRLAEVRDASLFAVRETVERRVMADEPCWLVRLEWLSGRETFECYHVDTGLAIATIETQESPMGAVEVTTYVEEYRDMGGVLVPVRSIQEAMGQRMTVRIDDVTHDDVEPAELDPPSVIRALMDGGAVDHD